MKFIYFVIIILTWFATLFVKTIYSIFSTSLKFFITIDSNIIDEKNCLIESVNCVLTLFVSFNQKNEI
jgi:hypothetical protein